MRSILEPTLRNFQHDVWDWYETMFRGTREEHTTKTLGMRFLEEALELAQAVGLSKEDVMRQMEYTFSRPKGTVESEIAGTIITLQHIAGDHIIDVQDEALKELRRISTQEMRKKIYDKQAFKRDHGLVA